MWPWWVSLLTGLGGIIIALIGACLAPWMQERLALKRELAATYLAPFVQWCSRLYEELSEFKKRYIKADYNETREIYESLSLTLIIMDYRELHDALREAPKYIGKIAQENTEISEYLQELIGPVDELWHGLQDKFGVNFDQSEHDVWIDAIIKFPEKKQIVNTIKDSDLNKEVWEKFRENEDRKIRRLTTYLQSYIPKGKP